MLITRNHTTGQVRLRRSVRRAAAAEYTPFEGLRDGRRLHHPTDNGLLGRISGKPAGLYHDTRQAQKDERRKVRDARRRPRITGIPSTMNNNVSCDRLF